ncbi:IS21-like element helper ATPase IstB [Streptomyces sp. RP5T]|uniref:IS21-like element helper ATPase IstB n=1 Tax=Streptomyces sp. RP5T TaxID=2490848 RepID=UPI000F655BBC|nr:IS21-like element helper ATPase IstB [Streptomyces sp. RP5T]RRR85791.1 ATP-binding protein [Streptomyces sp. RP5T]
MATPIRTITGAHGDPLAEAIELTKRLKLPHLRRALSDLIPTAKAQRWDPAEVVRVLLAEEAAGRDAANLRTRRKRAGFPAGKTFGDWDEQASSITRQVQDSLKTLEWIGRRENLCICGPSGTGKSHFTEALGQAAVEAGLTVAWFTIEDLGALIRRHRADDSLARAMTRLIRTDLIIVDDIGLLPVSPDAAEGFYRLVDAAYERRALAVSSNLHPSGFDEIMPKTLATATVDRLLHHAHVVVTQGESFRLTEATTGKGVMPLR